MSASAAISSGGRTRFARVLGDAAERFAVLGPLEVAEDGRVRRVDPERLVPTLAERIYRRCHLGLAEEEADVLPLPLAVREHEDGAFVARLRRHAAHRCHPDPGWRVVGPAAGGVEIERGVRLVAPADRVSPGTGGFATVELPCERRYAVAGFYLVRSRRGPPADEPLGRIYLNVPAEHAVRAFVLVLDTLDHAGVRYEAKALNHPSRYARRDGIVVYLPRPATPVGVAAIDRAVPPAWRRRAAPGFAQRVARGLGTADEPAQAGPCLVSLGQDRSRRVAEGLVAAGGGATSATRLDAICATFAAAGLDPRRPDLEVS